MARTKALAEPARTFFPPESPACFSRLLFSRARIPAYFPALGVGEVQSEPGVKGEKRWGPLFGGIIPWLRAKTNSPVPRTGRGGGRARGHAPLREASPRSSKGGRAENGAERVAEPRATQGGRHGP